MNPKDTKISVLGDGGWGTTLALLLADKKYSVRLWGAFPAYVDEIRKKRENLKFLPGFKIPENVALVEDIHQAVSESDIIVLAVPSQYMRSVLKKIKNDSLRGKLFVSVAKGIETRTLKVMSQVAKDELGKAGFAALSGPCIAREIALKNPAAAVIASEDTALRAQARKIFTTDYFSVFESDDELGVELGGAVKNVIAIASGIAEGLGFGSNTRAALFARGVAEMARLGQAMGARRETFMGLSGLGDLATTCLSPLSRNRWLGEEVGKGKDLKKILGGTEMVVEGVATSKSAWELAKKHKVSMPITEAVYAILFEEENPRQAVGALMKRHSHRELD
jgi:glycerol-3-phosphate dehydrogenase (NAD(P)+)